MDVRKLKEGELKRYKSGLLGSKWKDCHVCLFSDSTLAIYDKKGDSKAVEQFFLKDIAPYICVGLMTDRMPTKRPDVPSGCSVHHLVGFGQDPRAEKVTWIMFGSDSNLEDWFKSIMQTLPKQDPPPQAQQPPNVPPQSYPSQPPTNAKFGDYVPPSQYPAAPTPYIQGQRSPIPQNSYGPSPPVYNNGPAQANQPYYGGGQPQNTHTTVILDRDRDYGRGGGSSFGSSGLGLGSGMLMGGLLGYGIGSFFTPSHYYSGFGGMGGGFGMGSGFGGYPMSGGGYPMSGGGGYSSMQDNDTYNVTNNYYNNDNNTSTEQNSQNDHYNSGNNDDRQDDYQQDNDYDNDAGDYDNDGGDFGGDGGFDGGDW